MDTFRFVHAANLLLDRPFAALPPASPALAETLRDASLDAWDALVQLAIDCDAAALLLSARFRYTTGDILTIDGGLPEAFPR